MVIRQRFRSATNTYKAVCSILVVFMEHKVDLRIVRIWLYLMCQAVLNSVNHIELNINWIERYIADFWYIIYAPIKKNIFFKLCQINAPKAPIGELSPSMTKISASNTIKATSLNCHSKRWSIPTLKKMISYCN